MTGARRAEGRRGLPGSPAERPDSGRDPHRPRADRPGRYRLMLTILLMGGVIYAVAQSIMLPTINVVARGLHASTVSTAWVLTVFILSGGVATPVVGRLGDMYGKKRALVAMLAVVCSGILLSALTRSLPLMLVGRALAGTSSASFPLGFGIIRDEFPVERVASAVGIMSVSIALGTALGVLIAGPIAAHLSYHWLFWIPLMVAAPTGLAAWRWIPESPLKPGGTVDWVGAGLLVLGLLSILLGISQATHWGWVSARTAALILGGLGILGGWTAFELRVGEPLIDVRTMALPSVWRTNAAAALTGLSMFSAFAVIPRFVQEPPTTGYGFGAGIVGAGVYLLPSTITMVLVAPMAGRIERRVGSKAALIGGCVWGAAGFVLIAASPTIRWHVYAGMALVGVGLGLAYAALPNLIIRAVPQAQTGAATGINTVVRSVGGAIGVQICTTVIAQHVLRADVPSVGGYTAAFWICAACLTAATVVSLLVPARRRADAVVAAGPLLAGRPRGRLP